MPGKKILIVDDDPDILALVRSSLAAEGRSFITAADGVAAVETVFSETPDLVVLDVMMPRMNGYQACRLLKNDRGAWEVPILMLTAKAKDKDRYYGLSAGADDYIVKPFDPAELRAKVEELLEKSGGERKPRAEVKERMDETTLLSKVNSLLDRKLQELTFLQHMTKRIISTFDEDRIMETVLRGIETDVGFRRAAIFMRDGEGVMQRRKAIGFFGPTDLPRLTVRDDPSFARLVHDREAVVLTGGEAVGHTTGAGQAAKPAHQQCLAPIVFRDETKGALLVDRQAGEPPLSTERVGLLATLAGQLGLALENASLYKRTLHLSLTDGLTGLYNARYFYERLEIEISRARRYNRPLALFMLDIDYFKKFNDAYGHLTGDEALRHVARVVKETSRETDTAARYGGEEFCIILPETDVEGAEAIAERLRAAVESEGFLPEGEKQPSPLTVSIGVAGLTDGPESAEELVRMADKALYRAKKEGRNRVCAYR